jgi:DNA-binding PadR family transcriptional regulator
MSMAHAILGVLVEGECHGYQIAATLAERIENGPYNTGQVHQALERLEAQGMVVSRADDSVNRVRRLFALTAAGRQEFFAWLKRPVAVARPVRDEVVVKVVFLGRYEPERLRVLLEERRREHVQRLAYLQRRPKSEQGKTLDIGERLARDAFRFREEAELRWVEHCLANLGHATSHEATPADRASAGAVAAGMHRER